MKYLLLVLLFSCQISAQKESQESLEDKSLNSMMGKVNSNLSDNQKIQKAAEKESDKIVTKAANTITSLKAENANYKKKLDSITTITNDTSESFDIRGANR